jgi:hypothetical protein
MYVGGDFSMAKKGQPFSTYTEVFKREVVRLKLEEGWSTDSFENALGLRVMPKLPSGKASNE